MILVNLKTYLKKKSSKYKDYFLNKEDLLRERPKYIVELNNNDRYLNVLMNAYYENIKNEGYNKIYKQILDLYCLFFGDIDKVSFNESYLNKLVFYDPPIIGQTLLIEFQKFVEKFQFYIVNKVIDHINGTTTSGGYRKTRRYKQKQKKTKKKHNGSFQYK